MLNEDENDREKLHDKYIFTLAGCPFFKTDLLPVEHKQLTNDRPRFVAAIL